MLMASLPLVVAATGGAMAGPAPIFNAILSLINAASDTFWDYRIGMITGCEALDTNFTSDSHGIPLTSNLLKELDYTITESGAYYLLFDTGLTIGTGNSSSINVTICLHGFDCKITVTNGNYLNLSDWAYEEDRDGNMISESGSANITNIGGDVTIYSGRVDLIETSDKGYVTVEGGSVSRVRPEGTGAEKIQINNGSVTNIWDNKGNLIIRGGRIEQIINDGGNVEISGGHITRNGNGVVLQNKRGKVSISGGQINGYDGSDTVASGCTAIENFAEGLLTINGGTIIGGRKFTYRYFSYPAIENSGTLTIRDGIFACGDAEGGDICISNSGSAEIFGGKFLGQIDNDSSKTESGLTIYNGIFQATGTHNVTNY